LNVSVLLLKTFRWFGCCGTEYDGTRNFTPRAEQRLGNKEINGITRRKGDETRRE
jgi:hypothetical protein